jgi:hypothetical protein
VEIRFAWLRIGTVMGPCEHGSINGRKCLQRISASQEQFCSIILLLHVCYLYAGPNAITNINHWISAVILFYCILLGYTGHGHYQEKHCINGKAEQETAQCEVPPAPHTAVPGAPCSSQCRASCPLHLTLPCQVPPAPLSAVQGAPCTSQCRARCPLHLTLPCQNGLACADSHFCYVFQPMHKTKTQRGTRI